MSRGRRPVAIVTGGGSGVGLEIARALGADGYAVAIYSRSRERLEAAEESLRGDVSELITRAGDVLDDGLVDAFVDEAENELGQVEVVVHAAGSSHALGPSWEVDPGQWRSDVDTSLVGGYLMFRRVLPGMVSRGRGRLIALNTYAAVRSAPHNAAYGAGKAALASLVESLEAELEGTGVHAFSVTPGFVWTEMTEAMAATPWFASLAERGDALPPQRAAALVTRIARGDADPLAGRFLHALDDLDDLLAHIAEIERDELYVSRLRRLPPRSRT